MTKRAVMVGHSAEPRTATITALTSLLQLEPGALRDIDQRLRSPVHRGP